MGRREALFAETPVRNGSFALPVQHSKADLSLYSEGDSSNGNVDKAKADATGPCRMAGDGFILLFFLVDILHFGRLWLEHTDKMSLKG